MWAVTLFSIARDFSLAMAIKIHIASFRNGTTGKWVPAFCIVFLLYVIIPAFHASHGQALVRSDLMSPYEIH